MKKLFQLIVIITLSGFQLNSVAQVQFEENDTDESIKVSFGFENDFVTRYIWHGLNYNHGLIHQPTVWVTVNDFTFYSWGSFTQHEAENNIKNNEIDLAVQYSKQIDLLNIESSVTYIYALLEGAPATTEAYLKVGYQVLEAELFSDLTADVMEYTGSLSGSIGLSKSFYEDDNLSISGSLSFGWANKLFNENYIGTSKNVKPFNYTSFSAEATYYFYENFYIKPHMEYCYLFSPVLKQTSGNSLENFGIGAGVEF